MDGIATVQIPLVEYLWLCSVANAVGRLERPVYNIEGRSPIEAVMDAYELKPAIVTWPNG